MQVRNAINLNYCTTFADDVPNEARELVHGMLQVSACDRLTVSELISSTWVSRSGWLDQEKDVESVSQSCGTIHADDDDPKVHGRGRWMACTKAFLFAWQGILLKVGYAIIVVGALLVHMSGGLGADAGLWDQIYDTEN